MNKVNKRITQKRGVLAVALLALPLIGVTTSVQAANAPKAESNRLPEYHDELRARIAVVSFDYGSVSPWWEGRWQIGQGMAALVVDELVKQRNLDVYTTPLNTWSESTRNNNISVNGMILRGTITQFSFDKDGIGFDERERGGRYGHGRDNRRGGSGFGIGYSETRATVGVNFQLIDASTGRILKTFSSKSQSSRGSFTGFGINRGSSIYAEGVDFRSRNFQSSLIGEATKKCASDIAKQISKSINSLDIPYTSSAPLPSTLSGKVADIEGRTLIITIGADQGVRVGDVFVVEAPLKVIRDPDTGRVLEERSERLGTIRITSLSAHTATGQFEGNDRPKIGDRVHLD